MSSPIFGQLETSLAGYLADVVHRAEFGDERTAAAVARFEVPRLVEALKAVLDEHEPDEFGRCPDCRRSRFSRAPTPCRAYLSAHLCLVALDEPQPVEVTTPMRRPVVLAEPSGFRMLNAPG
ncbi:hypothetical protein [Actinophytocola sp.]|uniref:hypothetical protein n=1 Tax=Actinophytocola sp. TaxID=1872138 RepID=UPI003D6A8E42